MTTQQNNITREVRTRLIEVAGRTTQDLGLGRIIGQVLGDIYMTEGESSLDDIGHNLGLSKAAVSIAARQLENLGLLQRIWKKSDRKNYDLDFASGKFGASRSEREARLPCVSRGRAGRLRKTGNINY